MPWTCWQYISCIIMKHLSHSLISKINCCALQKNIFHWLYKGLHRFSWKTFRSLCGQMESSLKLDRFFQVCCPNVTPWSQLLCRRGSVSKKHDAAHNLTIIWMQTACDARVMIYSCVCDRVRVCGCVWLRVAHVVRT